MRDIINIFISLDTEHRCRRYRFGLVSSTFRSTQLPYSLWVPANDGWCGQHSLKVRPTPRLIAAYINIYLYYCVDYRARCISAGRFIYVYSLNTGIEGMPLNSYWRFWNIIITTLPGQNAWIDGHIYWVIAWLPKFFHSIVLIPPPVRLHKTSSRTAAAEISLLSRSFHYDDIIFLLFLDYDIMGRHY